MEVLIFIVLVLVGVVLWFWGLPSSKGIFGEAKVRATTGALLNKQKYRQIDNVTLPIFSGTTQIDHVIVSRYGVFVVETKNMKGWIFGNERQRYWTQTLYRKKYKFQNPLHQNYLHVKALEAFLRVPRAYIRSVVVFSGGSTFKTDMPKNVTNSWGLVRYIRSFDHPVFSVEECDAIFNRIEEARLPNTAETRKRHVTALRTRHSAASDGICPRCGGELVLRVSAKGPSKGNKFLGCSGFPNCRYTRSVENKDTH